MTIRPIIFSAPMVRALLDGRKSMTRRPLKLPKKTHHGTPIYEHPKMGGWAPTTIGGGGCFKFGKGGERVPEPEEPAIWHQTTGTCMALPYKVGDLLWVREAWRLNSWATDVATFFYRASEGQGYTAMCEQFPVAGRKIINPNPGTWKPSIHMPRWASRITLKVTGVKVERLQDISDRDAKAEGVPTTTAEHTFIKCFRDPEERAAERIKRFGELWNSIHGKDAWSANPWVVAVSFEIIKANVDSTPTPKTKGE